MDVRRTASRLSGDEVALVLRRAADIEAEVEGPGAVDGFEPAAVEEAAREVGLSPAAVRQALAELHAGALVPAGRSTLRARVRGTGPAPHLAIEARLVSSAAETVHTTTAGFLRRQAFDLRRHHGDRAVYRPRTDVGARVRRLANVSGAVQLTGVRSVTVTVTPLDPPPPAPTPLDPAPPPAPTPPDPAPPTTVPLGSPPPAAAPLDPTPPPAGGADRRAVGGASPPAAVPGDGPTTGAGAEPAGAIGRMKADPTGTPEGRDRHMVRMEAEVVGGRMGARARATGAAVALGGGGALVALVATGGFLLAAAAGIAGTAATRWWLGRRLLSRRRDEVREVLAALLDVVEDPTAVHHPMALGPGWSSRWLAPSTPAPTDAPWSTRDWWRTGWPRRDSRPAR